MNDPSLGNPLNYQSPGSPSKPLSGWGYQAVEHWKKYRPKMYAQLQKSGRLNEEAESAAKKTSEALNDLLEQGYSHDQAWEAVKENWMFLPSEEDQPNLGENPHPSSLPSQ